MSLRTETTGHFIIDGTPAQVRLIENPMIDDIVVAEAMLQATAVDRNTDLSSHYVERAIRDFLIRIGVER